MLFNQCRTSPANDQSLDVCIVSCKSSRIQIHVQTGLKVVVFCKQPIPNANAFMLFTTIVFSVTASIFLPVFEVPCLCCRFPSAKVQKSDSDLDVKQLVEQIILGEFQDAMLLRCVQPAVPASVICIRQPMLV